MKKIVILAAGVIAMMASCTSKNANSNAAAEAADSVAADATGLAQYPVDEEGYYVIFNGKDLNGWRGYGRDTIPSRWTVEDGAIKFTGAGGGEAQPADGGDIIFVAVTRCQGHCGCHCQG